MTVQTCDIAGSVAGYAARLHAAISDGHHVASPLGAWLLLALVGPASTGADRSALTEVLGCDVDAAANAAAGLLAHPHPLVAGAAAVWTQGGGDLGAHFRRWQAALPPEVACGPLPDQAGLDAWARENTFGLIERFPIRLDPEIYLVLATALATKVSWQVPFDLAPAAELGAASRWASQLNHVLRTPDPRRGGHRQFIALTPEAGDVAVHVATAQAGLLVFSVAADQAVPPGQVLAAAYQIGCAHAVGAPVQRRSLADLPLGAGPAWLLREDVQAVQDTCTAVLPAWSAQSRHDLGNPVLGFEAARDALVRQPDPWEAKQAAMARYSRTGFEAAAVTALAIALSSRLPQGTHRVAELRFAHPYAVVAVTIEGNGAGAADPAGPREWHGVPVFSAWVSEPEDAGDSPEPGAAARPPRSP
jgi:hypothetical protein